MLFCNKKIFSREAEAALMKPIELSESKVVKIDASKVWIIKILMKEKSPDHHQIYSCSTRHSFASNFTMYTVWFYDE